MLGAVDEGDPSDAGHNKREGSPSHKQADEPAKKPIRRWLKMKSEGKEDEGGEVHEGEAEDGDTKAESMAESKEAEGKEEGKEEGKDSAEAKYLESESAFFGVMRHSVRVDEVSLTRCWICMLTFVYGRILLLIGQTNPRALTIVPSRTLNYLHSKFRD